MLTKYLITQSYDILLKFKMSIRMRRQVNLSDFECETADLVGPL